MSAGNITKGEDILNKTSSLQKFILRAPFITLGLIKKNLNFKVYFTVIDPFRLGRAHGLGLAHLPVLNSMCCEIINNVQNSKNNVLNVQSM